MSTFCEGIGYCANRVCSVTPIPAARRRGPYKSRQTTKLSTFCFWVSTLENEFSCTHPKTKQMAHAICLLLRKGGDLNVAQSVSYCASSPRECRCRACAVRKYTTEVTPKLRESPTVAIATTAWSAVFFIGSRWEFTHRPTTNKKTTDIMSVVARAERRGFEPLKRFWRLLAFQAGQFNHSCTFPFFRLAKIE